MHVLVFVCMFHKMYLFILVFLFGFGGSVENGAYEGKKEYNYDRVFHGIVDQDYEEDITRPCALSDWQCIREFLASNSKCQLSYGPVPDPMKFPVDHFYIPTVNLTITHTDLRITGFRNAKITEFYLNKATGNLVVAINVQKINQTSPKSYFTYLRTAREPIILADFTTVIYDSATFTAVIPKAPHLQLGRAQIHADIHDNRPIYAIGPRAGNSTDPDVVTAFIAFMANIPAVVQEAYVFQSYLLTTTYIQKYLCDFGVDSYQNYLRFLGTKGYNYVQTSIYNDKSIVSGNNVYYNNVIGPLEFDSKSTDMY